MTVRLTTIKELIKDLSVEEFQELAKYVDCTCPPSATIEENALAGWKEWYKGYDANKRGEPTRNATKAWQTGWATAAKEAQTEVKPQDSTGQLIFVGDRVRWRGKEYTVNSFGARLGRLNSAYVNFDEEIDSEIRNHPDYQPPDELSVQKVVTP